MKIKVMVLSVLLLIVTTTGVFGLGIGLQFNGNAGKVFTSGVALTFKVDSVPLIFATNWVFDDDYSQFGFTGDYWLVNKKLTNIGSTNLNWFIGIGGFANFIFPKDDFIFVGGLRVPIGLNMFIAKGAFEPFLQVAPSFGVRLVPKLDAESPFFPISLGFRFWFK